MKDRPVKCACALYSKKREGKLCKTCYMRAYIARYRRGLRGSPA